MEFDSRRLSLHSKTTLKKRSMRNEPREDYRKRVDEPGLPIPLRSGLVQRRLRQVPELSRRTNRLTELMQHTFFGRLVRHILFAIELRSKKVSWSFTKRLQQNFAVRSTTEVR